MLEKYGKGSGGYELISVGGKNKKENEKILDRKNAKE
jgi:hypothetical protein